MEEASQRRAGVCPKQGCANIGGFPLDVEGKMSSTQMFSGKSSVFYKLGFKEAVRRNSRSILRLEL